MGMNRRERRAAWSEHLKFVEGILSLLDTNPDEAVRRAMPQFNEVAKREGFKQAYDLQGRPVSREQVCLGGLHKARTMHPASTLDQKQASALWLKENGYRTVRD